jgi:DnaJ family protein A protein 2
MAHGQKITFAGDVINNSNFVEQKGHARFQRKGDDLCIETEIDLLTALGGGKFAIPHLDGRCLIINVLPGEVVKPGEIKSVRGEGMPGYILFDDLTLL